MPREHPLSWHRVVPVAVLGVLALVAVAALSGPLWYQRLYYPVYYQSQIGVAARAQRLDPYLVTAVVHAESGFDASIVSKAGAVGLMQVMPETADDIEKAQGRKAVVSRKLLEQPADNLRYGTVYLRQLIDRYDGDTSLALAAYNAGVVNADRWQKRDGGRIGFPETEHYVKKVLKERDTYARLYPAVYR